MSRLNLDAPRQETSQASGPSRWEGPDPTQQTQRGEYVLDRDPEHRSEAYPAWSACQQPMGGRTGLSYKLIPKTAPTPAVTAMASAPQHVTRRIPFTGGAPPTRDETAPRSARSASEATATIGPIQSWGDTRIIANGIEAPAANDAAEVTAAWTGRATRTSEIPSSSRA